MYGSDTIFDTGQDINELQKTISDNTSNILKQFIYKSNQNTLHSLPGRKVN
jgi:hypothetical protein